MALASSVPLPAGLEDGGASGAGQAAPGEPVALQRRLREAGAALRLENERMQGVDRLQVAGIGDAGDLDALALGAADGVARVLVESGHQRLVVGQLHEARLADLQRLRLVAELAEQAGRRAATLQARLQLHGDRAVAAGGLAQADGHGPHPIGGPRVLVVHDRTVRDVPEAAAQRQPPHLGGRDAPPARPRPRPRTAAAAGRRRRRHRPTTSRAGSRRRRIVPSSSCQAAWSASVAGRNPDHAGDRLRRFIRLRSRAISGERSADATSRKMAAPAALSTTTTSRRLMPPSSRCRQPGLHQRQPAEHDQGGSAGTHRRAHGRAEDRGALDRLDSAVQRPEPARSPPGWR